MMYLIDTDWVIDHLSDMEEAVQLLDELSEDSLAIGVFTYLGPAS
jgi:hypothetical protein